jgi:Rho-binding antiterminator
METPYQPITCNFYDILQDYATKGTYVKILYLTPLHELVSVSSIIKDFITTADKEEYIVLAIGEQIRLDAITKVQTNINPAYTDYFNNSCS